MSHLLPRFHRRAQAAADAAKIASIVVESGAAIVPLNPGAGMHADKIRLRGIPVVGGASGVSPGTDPVLALEGRERRGELWAA